MKRREKGKVKKSPKKIPQKSRKKSYQKGQSKQVFKTLGFVLLGLIFIASQAQLWAAFEAHIINVTATIVNDMPSADPPGGEFCPQDAPGVALSASLPGAIIWYTLDNTEPVCNGNGQQYTDLINLPIGVTVLQASTCHDDKQSGVVSWLFDISNNYCQYFCYPEQELVLNGGFEIPIVSTPEKWNVMRSGAPDLAWTVEWQGGLDTYNEQSRPEPALLEFHRGVNGWLPQAGEQYVELDTDWDGPGGPLNQEPASVRIYQDISTVPGQNYTITFHFSPRPNTDSANNILQFSWDGVVRDTLSAVGDSNTIWSEHVYTFAATGLTTRLQFADLGTADSLGTFLDSVSVNCAPPGGSDPSDCMKINEVYYDSIDLDQAACKPPEEKYEWIELYNACDFIVNLQNWYLKDNSDQQETINQSYLITPGQFVVIASNAAVWQTYWTLIPENAVKIALGGTIMFNGLDNNGDRVVLYDKNDVETDAVSWGTDTYAFDPSVPDVPEGYSIARKSAGLDTNTATDWEGLASPNPGTNPHDICQNGANRPCGTEVGACLIGVQICEHGVWGECIGVTKPAKEICDGVDNDCDGKVDESISCSGGNEAFVDVLPIEEPPIEEEPPVKEELEPEPLIDRVWLPVGEGGSPLIDKVIESPIEKETPAEEEEPVEDQSEEPEHEPEPES